MLTLHVSYDIAMLHILQIHDLQRDQGIVMSNHAKSFADTWSNILKHHKQQQLDTLKEALTVCHQKALSDLKLAQGK